MKKLLSVILMLVLLSSLLVVPVQAAGSGSLSMTSASGSRGDTVTLNVRLNSNPGLVTMSIRVSYDTSVLQLTGVSDTGVLVGSQLNSSYGSPYSISWVDGATTANNTSTGTIATFTFKILDNAAIGDSTVTLQFLDSFDTNYAENSFSASSGKVSVVCKSHNYSSWTKVDEKNHSKTCSVCQDVKTEAHAWDKGSPVKEANCKEPGETKYTCTACKATKNETVPKTNKHSFGNLVSVSDTQHKDVCKVCNQEVTENHTWNSGAVTTQPTCTKEGVKTYTCTGCKATKTESVDKKDHSFGAWEKVDANSHKRTCTMCKEETETGTHNYKTSWSKDANNHWHECAECKDKKDSAAHTPGPEATEEKAQTCTVCSYVIKPALGHKHDYATEWTTDDKGHWYACAGCEEKGSYADHDFENACDKDCSICGLTRETAHKYEEKWTTDGTNHWHACTGCGLKADESAHTAGPEATATTAQTCTVCAYEIAPALGGEDANAPTQAGAEPAPEDEFPWWILIIVAVVVIGGVVFVIIKKKKA